MKVSWNMTSILVYGQKWTKEDLFELNITISSFGGMLKNYVMRKALLGR